MKNTKIIAAWCGTGKTKLCELREDCVEIEYWKYKDKSDNEYVSDIICNTGRVEYIFISTDPIGLKVLSDLGYEILLVYPRIELRNEYLDRYIKRDSPSDFIGVFMKFWDVWIREMTQINFCKHYVLKSGEFLSDIIQII